MDFHLVLSSDCRSVYRYFKVLCVFIHTVLNEEKSVNATAALRKSMQDTNGYKLQMFCAEFIPNLLIYAVMAIRIAFKDSVCRYIVCGYHSHSSACIYIVCTVVLRSCTRRFL